MVTSGIYILLVVALVPIVFVALQAAMGERAAFLTLCWLPMGGLMAMIGLHHHLGYSVLVLLAMTLTASVCLTLLGGGLCAKARRENAAIWPLVVGILIAGLPVFLLGGWLAVNR